MYTLSSSDTPSIIFDRSFESKHSSMTSYDCRNSDMAVDFTPDLLAETPLPDRARIGLADTVYLDFQKVS